uniref:Uncharacterized protein n=1 Tax=Acrobeloides nanus TaxID=290746 RepID=A0A914EC76_9BILA
MYKNENDHERISLIPNEVILHRQDNIEQKAAKIAWKLKFTKSGATDFKDALKNSHLQNLRKHSIKSIFMIL